MILQLHQRCPSSARLQDECAARAYQNPWNRALLNLLDHDTPGSVLDCGCGSGDNGRVLAAMGYKVTGVTISPSEQAIAQRFCHSVIIHDLDEGLPSKLDGPFNVVILSHVLEHLRQPCRLLADIKRVIASDGLLLVALPNTLHFRHRFEFLFGRFEYRACGIMDATHLHFYTYESGRRLLELNGFHVVRCAAEGAFPLPVIRRALPNVAGFADRLACKLLPGLFASQLLYVTHADENTSWGKIL